MSDTAAVHGLTQCSLPIELHYGPCLWQLFSPEFLLFEEKLELPAMTAALLIFPRFSIPSFITEGEKSDFAINSLMWGSNPALVKDLLSAGRSVSWKTQHYCKQLLTWSLWARSKCAEYRHNEWCSQVIPAPLAPCIPAAARLFVGCVLVGWVFLLLHKQPKQSTYTCSHFLRVCKGNVLAPFSRNCPASSEAPAACCGCSALFLSVSVLSQQMHSASLASQMVS